MKFHPIFKDKIWGGEKIRTILKKDFSPLPNCGESWELSGVRDNESEVKEGPLSGWRLPELLSSYRERLVGRRVYETFGNEFPLLVKFIDANEDLSIQVHPGDELAGMRHDSFGKTEMWYILQADEGAELIAGFNQEMDRNKYLQHVDNNTISEVLNRIKVYRDDVFYIPAGRIHTVGKGLLLAEIQQSSDVTYRIYDFNRKDQNNNYRELHIHESVDAIDYTYYEEFKSDYNDRKNTPVELVRSKYFTTNKIILNQKLDRNMEELDSFVIYMVLGGKGSIVRDENTVSLELGDVVLVPAELTSYSLVPESGLKLLESFITP